MPPDRGLGASDPHRGFRRAWGLSRRPPRATSGRPPDRGGGRYRRRRRPGAGRGGCRAGSHQRSSAVQGPAQAAIGARRPSRTRQAGVAVIAPRPVTPTAAPSASRTSTSVRRGRRDPATADGRATGAVTASGRAAARASARSTATAGTRATCSAGARPPRHSGTVTQLRGSVMIVAGFELTRRRGSPPAPAPGRPARPSSRTRTPGRCESGQEPRIRIERRSVRFGTRLRDGRRRAGRRAARAPPRAGIDAGEILAGEALHRPVVERQVRDLGAVARPRPRSRGSATVTSTRPWDELAGPGGWRPGGRREA